MPMSATSERASSIVQLEQYFAELLKHRESKSRPPVESWRPERKGEIDISINAQGEWFHEGARFKRQALVELFASILRFEDDEYYLVTPVEQLRIEVADVPLVVVDVDQRGKGAQTDIVCTTNTDDVVLVDVQNPLEMRKGVAYVHVRHGLYAKFNRPAFYRLVEMGHGENLHAQEVGRKTTDGEQNVLAVYSQGERFELGAF